MFNATLFALVRTALRIKTEGKIMGVAGTSGDSQARLSLLGVPGPPALGVSRLQPSVILPTPCPRDISGTRPAQAAFVPWWPPCL